MRFLTTQSAPRSPWPWTYTGVTRNTGAQPMVRGSFQPTANRAAKVEGTVLGRNIVSNLSPMSLTDFPRPVADNGRGVHWIPTISQTPEIVDRFVDEALEMGMKWVLFLNEGTNIGKNDYLVSKLTQAGIEPIMRIYTPGLTPIQGDIQAMVKHYANLGVNYFQLYNEPNLMVETGGQYPSVERYLNLWLPAARDVIKAGGLPGFGALSPQGEMDDRQFLRQALTSLVDRGQADVLDRTWLSMHNYTGPRPMSDPDGFMRFKQYDAIVQKVLGRSIPIIGTEGGTHVTEHVPEHKQVEMVLDAYKYMAEQREPYNFAYTYWILANGHDPAWNDHALIRPEGPTALAKALKETVYSRQ